jgi:2-keto-4-pentenoate hydratase/2-oxohepta-3-ene-1,7-dioic acid hydratase in catechol pathway
MRVGEPGREKPALLDQAGKIRDLSDHLSDIGGEAISPEGLAKIHALDPRSLPELAPGRLGACVAGTGKFICIGLNFSDHAAETGATVPSEPVIFMKATSAIVGPNDDVLIPRGSEKTDWEVELGVVIGKTAKYVSEADALDYVAGYCVSHDVSERAFQTERSGQWTKGKSSDTFGSRSMARRCRTVRRGQWSMAWPSSFPISASLCRSIREMSSQPGRLRASVWE